MLIKLQNGLIYNDDKYFYCNDNNFMLDRIIYKKDDNERCYRLEKSCCLRADCYGQLVRKRISRIAYFKRLDELKSMIPTKEDLRLYYS